MVRRCPEESNHRALVSLEPGRPVMFVAGHSWRWACRPDNEVSWCGRWLLDRNCEVFRFVRELIASPKRNPVLSADIFHTEEGPSLSRPPDWDESAHPHMPARTRVQEAVLCLLFNIGEALVEFCLSVPAAVAWCAFLTPVRQLRATYSCLPANRKCPTKGDAGFLLTMLSSD